MKLLECMLLRQRMHYVITATMKVIHLTHAILTCAVTVKILSVAISFTTVLIERVRHQREIVAIAITLQGQEDVIMIEMMATVEVVEVTREAELKTKGVPSSSARGLSPPLLGQGVTVRDSRTTKANNKTSLLLRDPRLLHLQKMRNILPV